MALFFMLGLVLVAILLFVAISAFGYDKPFSMLMVAYFVGGVILGAALPLTLGLDEYSLVVSMIFYGACISLGAIGLALFKYLPKWHLPKSLRYIGPAVWALGMAVITDYFLGRYYGEPFGFVLIILFWIFVGVGVCCIAWIPILVISGFRARQKAGQNKPPPPQPPRP
jgi:hypothetical protein